eukprot:11096916-Lingulodinium_polyedra.AAC.1
MASRKGALPRPFWRDCMMKFISVSFGFGAAEISHFSAAVVLRMSSRLGVELKRATISRVSLWKAC